MECNKSDGYRYYLKRDPVENDDVTEWMLSFLRLASLGDMLKFHNKVMLDTPPYNTEYLDDILAAIDKQYLLKFKYVSGFGAESDIVLQPAFVRYFKQRWYVVGVKKQRSASEGKANSSAEEDVRKLVRVLPFDRISFLKIICEKHPLPAKMKKFLTPENYYEDCFGIYRMEDVPVEKIRIRAFYPEYNYIEEVPLHESQQKVKESKDGMYREYTLTIRQLILGTKIKGSLMEFDNLQRNLFCFISVQTPFLVSADRKHFRRAPQTCLLLPSRMQLFHHRS